MKATIFNIQKFSLHDGPGIRTAVFFAGCNLRCKWCANPEAFAASAGPLAGREYELSEVLAEVLKDKPFYDSSGGGVTLTGGEPLLRAEFVRALYRALHEEGVTVAVETAGNVPAEMFEAALECDFLMMDVKHWDKEAHIRGTGTDNRLILENLRRALARQMPVTVRIPVIPGFNDSLADARKFAELLTALGADAVHLLPFHQLAESKYARLELPYAYSGVEQLHAEDICEFEEEFRKVGLKTQIGG